MAVSLLTRFGQIVIICLLSLFIVGAASARAPIAAVNTEHGLAIKGYDPVAYFTSGKPARMTRGQIILHVCLHGTYHRGNAGALLQLRGLTPSRDAITDFLDDAA